MPEAELSRIMTFATPKDLGEWLKVNHATESELWLNIFKKNTGIQSVTWNDGNFSKSRGNLNFLKYQLPQ